ncbi:MAG TPA: T9SS type A sorting domain-containing protein, partial [Chitinispirillaceae bacterium]|nr:T9SS type A sorting domain-containing protein [Chitinispirillaceae bacterium]
TTDWTTWLSKDITLTFSLGYNTITLISTDDQGGPNIDKIVLDQGTNTLLHTSKEPGKSLHFNYSGKVLCIQAATSNMVNVCIFSLNGKIVFSKNFNNISGTGKIELPLNRFRNGIYLIRAESDGYVKTGHMNLL